MIGGVEDAMAEESITVTVSGKATVDWIRNQVREGHFESESEVVTHSIASLREEEDAERELWLKEVIPARYQRYKANPGSAIPIEQVERHLEERRASRA
jgi:Arc/MetJ-type ribon-helix-helix transcriptional regulator